MTGGLKMAEVEFGDTELFEQLDGEAAQPVHIRFDQTEDSEVEANSFHGQLARCEETIEQLRAENQELRRKLSILSRPSGLSVDDVLDGPLLQILFMNHVISKQYHQEIEDFVADLLQKHEEEERANPEKTTFNIKPQPSSISLEASENSSVNAVKKIKEAFSVVGSVLYFTNFCLDKLGQPLLNENPQLTDGWEVPKYQQVFGQILSLDGQEVQLQVKTKRPKPCCFNCGSEDHQLRDCPKPRDLAHIDMKRKAFRDSCAESGNQNYQQRYHVEEVAERFGKFKPGNISEELQEALGISDRHLPPFIYRMRQLGYPPGWLKDAELENSGLSLYDGKDSSDGEIVEEAMQKRNQVSYDVSKLVSYPGFNTPSVPGVADDWRSFGSIPMQPDHQKEVLANYLCSNFPDPQHNAAQKRTSSRSSSDAKRQKTSGNGQGQPSLDMDIASDGSYCSPSQRFKFQPPLPPGSPYNTPPSLPRGTPPSTPPNFIPPPPPTPTPPPLPKGTPPPTPPSRGSPLLLSRDGFPLQPKVADSMDEDTLTLEELEEQQRLIWAALENAESTNSESDVHTPLNGNSVSSSPSRVETDSVTEGKNTSQNIKALKNSVLPRESVKQESNENVLVTTEEESFNKDPNVDAPMQEMVVTEPIDNTDEKKTTCVETDVTEEAACVDPSSSNPRIPDRSKFAEGITPFEFENMSESTGIYLRLRDVLKNSPRNQQKNKQGM